KDPTPSFLVRVVSIAEFSPALFAADVKGPGTAPRVVAFSNVAKYTKEQTEATEKFLTDGGSVLLALGDRCDAAAYNRTAFRGGQGWLPARLVDVVGTTERIDDAPRPQPASFAHPMMEVFKEPLPGGLHTAYFPKRWKVDTAAGGQRPAAGRGGEAPAREAVAAGRRRDAGPRGVQALDGRRADVLLRRPVGPAGVGADAGGGRRPQAGGGGGQEAGVREGAGG